MPYEIHVRTDSGALHPLPEVCDRNGKPVEMTAGIACIVIQKTMDAQKMDPNIPASKLFTIQDFTLIATAGAEPVTLMLTEEGHVGALYPDGIYILPTKDVIV